MIEHDIVVSVATYEQKKKAVIECLKLGKGFSIRDLRRCVANKVSISEKTVSRILRELYVSGVVIKSKRRWYLADNVASEAIIIGNTVRYKLP